MIVCVFLGFFSYVMDYCFILRGFLFFVGGVFGFSLELVFILLIFEDIVEFFLFSWGGVDVREVVFIFRGVGSLVFEGGWV